MTAPLLNSQNVAADPRASCFLTANAGSGKTSTLVNRVARLLLAGAKPEHILCVTYTKAAAAEMQGRLFERLGGWAVADDETLARQLHDIDEAVADLPRARALFAGALETPGGLKIQTIHAFCEKLLRRFPLEAGLSPAFQVLDDLLAADLARTASDEVLTLSHPDLAEVRAARDRLIRKLKVMGFEKLIGQFVTQHDDIAEAFAHLRAGHDNWPAKLFHALGLPDICTSHECLTAYAEGLGWQMIRDLAAALSSGGSQTNQTAGQAFLDLHIRFHAEGDFDFDLLKTVFFTKDGGLRKNPYTKETAPGDAIVLDRLAREVAELAERLKAVDIAEATLDGLRLFAVFSHVYQTQKALEGALDFQDLINRTKALLLQGGMAAWVLFKLDGGLEHILVDEAQDTSQDQWEIVKALSEDFFSGHGQVSGNAARRTRTVFGVGDEKQSIYGFQGADPAEFRHAGQYFSSRAAEANRKFVAPELIESWRSLPEILGFVDAVFATPEVAEALNFTGEIVRHAARRDGRGLIELWPQAAPIDAVEVSVDDDDEIAALDETTQRPARRLARQLAAVIRDEIAGGRSVFDKSQRRWRPMHAGDVLILVRKRDLLFEHIIRELKMAGVAVSGADRLKLGEHIAFQDLRALMRFCLQPRDDLALACVLRSPLCDIAETALFDLAYGRRGSLWQVLLNRHDETGPFAEARTLLTWALRLAHALPTFDFLARVLNRRDGEGRSIKQRFLTRLGDEAEDVLDETLALALKGEGAGAVGLAACLDLFEYNATQIKREQEEGGTAVRVMTVHGSKGLEAPWVILPVGPQHGNARKDDLLLIDETGLFLCAGGRKADTAGLAALREARARRDEKEGLRLLYVALTRARDRLTLCGYQGKKAAARSAFPPWYDLLSDAFDRLPPDEVTVTTMALKAPFDSEDQAQSIAVRQYGAPSEALTAEAAARARPEPLPDFVITRIAQSDVDAARDIERWQAISQLGDEDRDAAEPGASPLESQGGLGRYRRGNLIHKLFEILPDMPVERRDATAARFLDRQPDLDAAQRDEMRHAVMAVLRDDRFAEAFGPGSRPEVAVAGQIGVNARGEAMLLSGRIDRLVILPDRVLIIDYKSNRPAPDRAEDAAVGYQRQMAGYVALLQQVYPGRAIEAALLWTDGPKLTPLSETLVNLRLAEIMGR